MWCYKKSNIKKLLDIAFKKGTPAYVYNVPTLIKEIKKYTEVFNKGPVDILYAFKANSNREICSLIKNEGLGADVVSGDELKLAVELGFKKISFSGVGKTDDEIALAVKNRIFFINIESYEEFEEIKKISQRFKICTNISVRINPIVEVSTHRYTKTADKYSKFGVDFKTAFDIYKKASKSKYLRIAAVHFHLGSQITDPSYYKKALAKVISFIKDISVYGINIRTIDIGGGWGVKEGCEASGHQSLFEVIKPYLSQYSFVIEPGRSIVASCGVFLVKVLYRKKVNNRHIIIVDGGINSFIRPALYGVYHPVFNISRNSKKVICDVAGPLCESSDFLSRSAKISFPQRGDILCFLSCGAYGYVMSNEYNMREKPGEFLLY